MHSYVMPTLGIRGSAFLLPEKRHQKYYKYNFDKEGSEMEGRYNSNFRLVDDKGNMVRFFDVTVNLNGDDATMDYFIEALKLVAIGSADLINDIDSLEG